MTVANKILVSEGVGILTITDRYMQDFNSLLLEFCSTGDGEELKQFLYDNALHGIELGN